MMNSKNILDKNSFRQKNEGTRSNSIDFAKGLIIIFMLWGHCIQYMTAIGLDFFANPIFKTIYSFHMPCFALISGFLFGKALKRHELNEYFGKRVMNLTQVIVFGGLLLCLITLVWKIILQRTFDAGIILTANSNIWFLWSILSSTIAVSLAVKMSNNFFIRMIVLLFSSILVYTFSGSNYNLFLYPYFIFGWIISTYDKSKLLNRMQKFTFFAIPIFILMLFFFEKKHYIYTTGFYSSEYSIWQNICIDVFRYTIGFFGSVSILWIIKNSYKFYVKIPNFLKKYCFIPIEKIGQKSLQIYVLSIAFLSQLLSVLINYVYTRFPSINLFIINNQVLHNILFVPFVCLFFVFALYYIVKLFEKIKISKLIFGR